MKLTHAQQQASEWLDNSPARHNVLLAHRQWGKTHFLARKLLEWTMDGREILVFSPSRLATEELLTRVRAISANKYLPTNIQFVSYNRSVPAKGYDTRNKLVIGNESQRFPQVVWESLVRSGPAAESFLIGTPFLTSDPELRWLHRLAQNPPPNTSVFRQSLLDNPDWSPEAVQELKDRIPLEVWASEWLLEGL